MPNQTENEFDVGMKDCLRPAEKPLGIIPRVSSETASAIVEARRGGISLRLTARASAASSTRAWRK
jgi:hypothetical protein